MRLSTGTTGINNADAEAVYRFIYAVSRGSQQVGDIYHRFEYFFRVFYGVIRAAVMGDITYYGIGAIRHALISDAYGGFIVTARRVGAYFNVVIELMKGTSKN